MKENVEARKGSPDHGGLLGRIINALITHFSTEPREQVDLRWRSRHRSIAGILRLIAHLYRTEENPAPISDVLGRCLR
jgi:hypothetical protein